MSTGIFTENLVQNVLAIVLTLVSFFVSMRAFYVYSQTRNSRIFILALSMGVIALTGAADFASSNVTVITLNTDWFLYIGQATSFLFILLGFLFKTDASLGRLMRAHVLISSLIVGLLLLSPTLPPLPCTVLEVSLSGSRIIMCFAIFFFYISAFMAKGTRFSLLMSIAFFLLAFGYLLIAEKYAVSDSALFDQMGDIVRMVGLVVLLIATLEN